MRLYNGVVIANAPSYHNISRIDNGCAPMILRMMQNGICVDRDALSDLSKFLASECTRIEGEIEALVGRPINPGSHPQVRQLLFNELRLQDLHPNRKVKLTDTGLVSTGKLEIEAFLKDHPIVRLILKHRECDKLKGTYADAMQEWARRDKYGNWRVHTTIKTTSTDTGRLACVAEWTPVNVLGRGHIEMKHVKVGDYVRTHRRRWRKVTAVWRKGIAPMFRVTFSTGDILTCTGDHRLLVSNHERIEEMGSRQEKCESGSGSVQIGGISNTTRDSQPAWDTLSQYSVDLQESPVSSGVQSTSSNSLLPLKTSRKESDVWKDRGPASQLDWACGRWERVFDLFKGWQEAVCTSYRDGGSFRFEGDSRNVGCPSHRHQPTEQQTGQLGTSYSHWASENSLPSSQGRSICYVEKIEAAGSFEVFDITVEEDASYEACGVFSHNSENPNLQNIPIRSKLGRMIKACFIAPLGKLLVKADYAQIEMRMAAHLAQPALMMQTFNMPKTSPKFMRDVHVQTAMRVFGLPGDKIHPTIHRYPMKRAGFLILYMGSGQALQIQLNAEEAQDPDNPHAWERDECDTLIEGWYEANPEIRDWQDETTAYARRNGLVHDLFGRIRLVPEVRSCHEWIRGKGIRQACNMPVQSGAQGLIKLAMAELHDAFNEIRDTGVEELMQVHDELLVEVNEKYAEGVGELMKNVMENVCTLRVPIEADVEIKERWVELEKAA